MDERGAAARRICERLAQAGYRALLAGGCVRDMLLGVDPHDYDVATSARPDQVADLFDRHVEVGAAFGVVVVLLPEGAFEVASFRSDGPYGDGRHPDEVAFTNEEEDARRRDFTINALFLDPATDEIIDYVGGRADLDAKLVRAVGEPERRFAEDHLRLLRAVRFAARLDYAIEPNTLAAIRRAAPFIVRTSAERIRDEVLKMLTEGRAARAFRLLDETGLLEYVSPEVARMKGVEQPPAFHPEGDVFEHTLLMLERMERPTPALALAVLLHDVGKPLTQTHEDRIRFNNHDKVGAREAEKMGRRLHLPNEILGIVGWLIENHMRLEAAPKMRASKLKRFIRHPAFPELLELCRLDCLASHNVLDTVEWVRNYLDRMPPEELRPAPPLRGDDLIAMGYAPGPIFSEILEGVEDAQLEGQIATSEDARAFVDSHWPRHPSDKTA